VGQSGLCLIKCSKSIWRRKMFAASTSANSGAARSEERSRMEAAARASTIPIRFEPGGRPVKPSENQTRPRSAEIHSPSLIVVGRIRSLPATAVPQTMTTTP
jgi:hypothetical protein